MVFLSLQSDRLRAFSLQVTGTELEQTSRPAPRNVVLRKQAPFGPWDQLNGVVVVGLLV